MQPHVPTISITVADAARFARIVLGCLHREYPTQIAHVLRGDEDVRPPRELTPAFFGCYDWHSAVHGHWCLARLLRLFPQAAWADAARGALAAGLTAEKLAAETAYLSAPGREGFERPYGLAWLLQLDAEFRQWEDPDAKSWSHSLTALTALAVDRLSVWLPKLTHPVRSGEHSQSAFAMSLALDWARTAGERAFGEVLRRRAIDFYGDDREAPLGWEPSGHDFLSPCLAEADLMRRVLTPEEFPAWLDGFLPELGCPSKAAPPKPVACPDPADGKLAHLHGLNLSRAWMLEGIASALPAGDERVAAIIALADEHRRAGLAAVTDEHYALSHWLASFAVYLTTARGLR